MARTERRAVRERLARLQLRHLRDLQRDVRQALDADARDLLLLTDVRTYEPDALRQIVRDNALVRQIFVRGPDGSRLFRLPVRIRSPQEKRNW